jgi:hypothetical protein
MLLRLNNRSRVRTYFRTEDISKFNAESGKPPGGPELANRSRESGPFSTVVLRMEDVEESTGAGSDMEDATEFNSAGSQSV